VLIFSVFLGVGCSNSFTQQVENTQQSNDVKEASLSKVNLDLSKSGLEKLPSNVWSMTSLEELNLSNNRLTGALPAEIRQLRNLRILDASNNLMTGVPAEIGQLTKLQELNLSNNQLTGLPSELGNLTSLRVLDLRGNAVSQQDLAGIKAKLRGIQILE
jgi:Leucine-rich repeat (LRR) protein